MNFLNNKTMEHRHEQFVSEFQIDFSISVPAIIAQYKTTYRDKVQSKPQLSLLARYYRELKWINEIGGGCGDSVGTATILVPDLCADCVNLYLLELDKEHEKVVASAMMPETSLQDIEKDHFLKMVKHRCCVLLRMPVKSDYCYYCVKKKKSEYGRLKKYFGEYM